MVTGEREGTLSRKDKIIIQLEIAEFSGKINLSILGLFFLFVSSSIVKRIYIFIKLIFPGRFFKNGNSDSYREAPQILNVIKKCY